LHKKRFGQHFLGNRSILQRIVGIAELHADDIVFEIGPGVGALTRELASVVRRVVAIEIDRDLIPRLRAEMPSNVEIIEGDALMTRFPDPPFHVVANLPYNIAIPLLKRFIEHRRLILDVTILIQKEVADRLVAKPGDPAYGPLSVLVQYYAIAGLGFKVAPGAFTPRPKVDSAVIRLDWKPGVIDNRGFTDFVHRAFASRRKKLLNNLASIFPSHSREDLLKNLDQAGIPAGARPEVVSIDQFLGVYNRLVAK
jgi:16S rRNA (adenine1518-N6/adenine1519-N6)-dimethyltransferase